MTLPFAIAALHLLTFGLGFGSCWSRASALKRLRDESGLQDVFVADNLWGIAALLWLSTGLWRAFGGLEKGSEYYLGNSAFIIKMSLFALIILMELRPMITLIRWRIRKAKGQPIDLSAAPALARLTYAELLLLIPVVMMAAAMSRGIWY